MIKITIEKFTSEEYKETQNFVVKRTPTEQREKSGSMYGDGSEKVVFIEESEPREVTKRPHQSRLWFGHPLTAGSCGIIRRSTAYSARV